MVHIDLTFTCLVFVFEKRFYLYFREFCNKNHDTEMEDDTKPTVDEICRTCLSKTGNLRSLDNLIEGDHRTLQDALIFVCNLDVKASNKLPRQVCSDCEVIMCKADAFKRRCHESESFLYLQYGIDQNPTFQVEIEEKPVIKHEKTFKKPKSVKSGSKKPSVSKKKPPKSVLGVLIPEYKDEKLDSEEMPLSTASNSVTDVPMDCESTKDVAVKEEIPNDFDADIDFDFPLDFKQEDTNFTEMKMFTCSCEAIFNNEEEYKTHLEINNCRSYKKSMKIKLEKRNSLGGRIITIKKRIICPDCNVEFDTLKSCKIHQKTHRNDENGDYQCTYCMRKFNRKSSYTTHLKHHEEKSKIKYICDTCKREFQHKAHLDNHIVAVHTSDKGYTCEICLMKFSTEQSLETHKGSHKTEKKHQCDICNKAFYMLSTLNDHMRTHTGERPYLCSICGRGFSQKTNLAQHMRRHQGLKPFKCEDCDRRFVSKGELVAHTRKHSGAHPFVCDACGGGFTTSSSLAKHRRTHTGERPYACDLCPMRFAASGTLKNHRRTHTGEKPFQCSYCEKAFVQRQDLVSHIRCHTGERPFTCGCGQAFRKAAALKAHAKTHTRPVVSQGQPHIV